MSKTFLEAEKNVFQISLLLESLGFFVNQEKSVFMYKGTPLFRKNIYIISFTGSKDLYHSC